MTVSGNFPNNQVWSFKPMHNFELNVPSVSTFIPFCKWLF